MWYSIAIFAVNEPKLTPLCAASYQKAGILSATDRPGPAYRLTPVIQALPETIGMAGPPIVVGCVMRQTNSKPMIERAR
jgi:hypothetical protein